MPNVPYGDSLDDSAAARIPPPATQFTTNVQVLNNDALATKTIPIYTGTHRVGRGKLVLAKKGVSGDRATLPQPLPPETVSQIATDADLILTPVP